MSALAEAYAGRRVLVTGASGFKGSWLTLWLERLGARVTALGLAPETDPSHWDLARPDTPLDVVDIRDGAALDARLRAADPEIVFHLAAQALVRRSYADPLGTWETNVMGTAHLLDGCRRLSSLRAVVVVTSDKCYENLDVPWGYRETDALGGRDPYSASKAACEVLTASYRRSFFSAPDAALVATARAGNVVGGGDWAEDRLVPDIVRAVAGGAPLLIRSPLATRPWQHVLDCLRGYLLLGARLARGEARFAEAWNFGPAPDSNRTVSEVLDAVAAAGLKLNWRRDEGERPREAGLLYLESAKARRVLGWRPVWSFERTIAETLRWYRGWLDGEVLSRRQLEEFIAEAETDR